MKQEIEGGKELLNNKNMKNIWQGDAFIKTIEENGIKFVDTIAMGGKTVKAKILPFQKKLIKKLGKRPTIV